MTVISLGRSRRTAPPLAVAVFVANILLNVSLTLDFSRWYAMTALSTPLAFLALSIWAFYTALGGAEGG